MAMKAEIVSKETIKPSSPTPYHLQNFKLSLLDQLAPPFYVPILLFYTTPFGTNLKTISHKLKTSLSQVLTLYYPFCGTIRGNSTIECNDEGVVFIESRVPNIELSNVIKDPQLYENINELFPFDPYNVKRTLGSYMMGVHLNQFKCGGVALAVCFSHKIADASTAASFLTTWAAISSKKDDNKIVSPQIDEGARLFPPRNIEIDMTRGMVWDKNIVTKRFIFNGTNISKLRQKLTSFNFNPTRVEAVTALLWKSSLEAAKAISGENKFPTCIISHAVNIRNRIVPTLSNNSVGNLWQQAVSQLMEVEEEVGLCDLVKRVRETVRKIDGNYVTEFQSDEFYKVIIENLKGARAMVLEKGVPCYSFSSWVRFGFYEVDFGWRKPSYVRTIGVPMRNVVILMERKVEDDDGIEAWVTLNTDDMVQFEQNPELLEFVFIDT